MDISPLPHKAPFSFLHNHHSLPLPSPSPEVTPTTDDEMMSPCDDLPTPPPQYPTPTLEVPRPLSAAEYARLAPSFFFLHTFLLTLYPQPPEIHSSPSISFSIQKLLDQHRILEVAREQYHLQVWQRCLLECIVAELGRMLYRVPTARAPPNLQWLALCIQTKVF